MSYSKKKRQLQEEKEARLNKTPEKKTRSVIKQSKAFVRKVSYSYGIRLIDEVSQARERQKEGKPCIWCLRKSKV